MSMNLISSPYPIVGGGGGAGCSLLSTAPTANLEFDFVGECLVGADGAGVTNWDDVSSNDNDITELNNVAGPYIKKTNIVNGLAVIRAVGAAEWALDIPLAISNFTYIAVLSIPSTTGYKTLFSGLVNSLQIRIGLGKLNIVKTAAIDMGSQSTALTAGTFFTVAVTYDGTALKFYLNGAADGTVSTSQTFSANMTTAWINKQSGDQNWEGDVARQLFWTSVLNEATHLLNGGSGVTDELRTKYAHYGET